MFVSITNVITFLGALATFLFGMSTMTSGLEKLSNGRLETIMEKLTDNIFKSVLVGALVTGLIHSSAATTVMCVGFVNSGIMKLEQTIGIIMGANIGTTVTAQILRLGDLSSESLIVSLMTPQYFGPMMAIVGIILYAFLSGGKKRIVGQIFLGLGLLFISMKTMENSVAPLADLPQFQKVFVAFSNPILGILAGALVTALVQSSTASVGILQALTSTGIVTYSIAMPIIFGQNIGTCITSLLSSIGASRNAKRTAALHLLFNIIGTLLFMVVLYGGQLFFQFPFWNEVANRGSIADIHTIFNVTCTIVLLPFNKLLVKLARKLVPGDGEQEFAVLDERFLTTPALALERANHAVIQMGQYARDNYALAVELLNSYDTKKVERLNETEHALDKIEDMLDGYLVKLTHRSLTPEENATISELFHTIGDFERIGDYAVNISETAAALRERNLSFSSTAKFELDKLISAVGEITTLTSDCYTRASRPIAIQVEPLEQVVDLLKDELQVRHIERLKDGECTIELGTHFLELLINLERISDHCSNVALNVIRQTSSSKHIDIEDAHEYIRLIHQGASPEYNRLYADYREKYYLPVEQQR